MTTDFSWRGWWIAIRERTKDSVAGVGSTYLLVVVMVAVGDGLQIVVAGKRLKSTPKWWHLSYCSALRQFCFFKLSSCHSIWQLFCSPFLRSIPNLQILSFRNYFYSKDSGGRRKNRWWIINCWMTTSPNYLTDDRWEWEWDEAIMTKGILLLANLVSRGWIRTILLPIVMSTS